MCKIRIFFYILKQSFVSIFKNLYMIFASVFVIFVSLYIMSCLALTSYNLKSMLDRLSDMPEIQIDCEVSVSDESSVYIENVILNDVRCDGSTVIKITKEENLTKAIELFGENSGLSMYGYKDFMFVSFRVKLFSAKNVEGFCKDIMKVPGVNNVSHYAAVYETFAKISFWVELCSYIALAVLGFLSIFLSVSTIRLTVFARRDELSIMRCLGASRAYMSGPFIMEGLVIGLLSGGITYLAVRTTYTYVYDYVQSISPIVREYVEVLPFKTFDRMLLLCFFIAAVAVGIISSYTAIKKYAIVKT